MKSTSCGRCVNSILLSIKFIAAQGDLFPFDGGLVFPPTEESTVGPDWTRFDPKVEAAEVEFCFDNASSSDLVVWTLVVILVDNVDGVEKDLIRFNQVEVNQPLRDLTQSEHFKIFFSKVNYEIGSRGY